MTFIATGDIQAHAWKQFSKTTEDGLNSRLSNILKVFDFLEGIAVLYKTKKIFINGDVLEESDHIPVQTYNSVFEKLEGLEKRGFDVVLNLGNHDITRNEPLVHDLKSFRSVATVVETPTIVWGSLAVIPYQPDTERLKKEIKSMIGHARILALHASVHGAAVGPKNRLMRCPLKTRDLQHDKFDAVILSDFHTSQFLTPNVLYLGSPIQHTFGETHKPAVWLIKSGSDFSKPKIVPKYTNFPRFKNISVSKGKMKALEDEKLKGHYVRVESDGVSDNLIEKKAKKIGYSVHVVGAKKKASKEVSVARVDIQKLLRRYVKAKSHRRDHIRLLKLGRRLLS